ncbi:MAG: MmgE/PrpD family protein, partial [Planctomycetales bacterium]|nr:MmgE/PrpD family protein [Planctomycetales bacterium]
RCGLFGDAATAAPATAALINGMLVHTLDFDDTHVPSSTHTSAPVIPAALAAAQHANADGKTTL